VSELLRLRLPADPVFVSVARESVVSLARGLGFNAEDREALRLAVGEACNNAAEHGGDREMFTLRCLQDSITLVVEIVSAPSGFQPEAAAQMPLDANAEHGRGRALMEALMDSVAYELTAESLTVRLKKRLPSVARS
jgi:serine/threonine-protein kinase RsbW